MLGVDVMLMVTSTQPFSLDYSIMEIYECLIEDDLLDGCKAVVLRIVKENNPIFPNAKPLTANDILTKSGLSKASKVIKEKLCEN